MKYSDKKLGHKRFNEAAARKKLYSKKPRYVYSKIKGVPKKYEQNHYKMKARYNGTCGVCKQSVAIGDDICYHHPKRYAPYKVVHLDCHEDFAEMWYT